MTVTDVQQRLVSIQAEAQEDCVEAHEQENTLWFVVLRDIAAGTCADPQGCAREALKSREIDFDRWFC